LYPPPTAVDKGDEIVSTRTRPVLIEEFSVDSFLVRSFEYSNNKRADWETVYAFPVYKKTDKPLKVIVLEWHNLFGFKAYFLEETFNGGNHATYEIYEQRPEYTTLKDKVILILQH
jgi:hypothetical protein